MSNLVFQVNIKPKLEWEKTIKKFDKFESRLVL